MSSEQNGSSLVSGGDAVAVALSSMLWTVKAGVGSRASAGLSRVALGAADAGLLAEAVVAVAASATRSSRQHTAAPRDLQATGWCVEGAAGEDGAKLNCGHLLMAGPKRYLPPSSPSRLHFRSVLKVRY